MVGAHVGHDVQVGSDVTLVNGAMLAGHCAVADQVILSGLSVVHQFTRIGRLAMLSGLSGVSQDCPPFCIVDGINRLVGVNVIGLRRAGTAREDITTVREAYRLVLRHRFVRADAARLLAPLAERSALVAEMAEFISTSKRGVCAGVTTRRFAGREGAPL
jgi:UDP-N-acetylglucosamine acyltransferase